MFTGIIFFDENGIVSSAKKKEIKQSLSRYRNENIHEIDLNNAYFVYSDIGTIAESSETAYDNKQASLLAGQPFLSHRKDNHYLSYIHNSIKNDDLSVLSSSRGVFCGAFYWLDKGNKPTICLCSDKLGIRPLYYFMGDSFIIFSTALRVLEKLSFITKLVDDDSICQIVGLGFPLGKKTQYKNLHIVNCAEVVSFKKNSIVSKLYWDWNTINTDVYTDSKSFCGDAYDLFKDSIKIRLKNSSTAVSYLSGGMDSRLIVGVLSDMRIKTFAFNFSPTGSQDFEYAKQFAKIAQDVYFYSIPRDYDVGYNFRCDLAQTLSDNLNLKNSELSGIDNRVWSGDGGSVGVGCVYLNEEIVKLLEAGDLSEAVLKYFKLNNINLPVNIINKESFYYNKNLLFDFLMSEIEKYSCLDNQKIFMYLMLNDQRRHLHDFYEDIDLHRLEYELPFWDSSFLELMFSMPIEYRLNHRFYTDWFYFFPPIVRKVPWQTYKGHIECPISTKGQFDYQWAGNITLKKKLERSLRIGFTGIKLSLSNDEIGFFSKKKIFLRSLIHLFCLKDYAYAVRAAEIYKSCAFNTDLSKFK